MTELRKNLQTYLAQVRRGARIRVTTHGKVIAEIVPPSADEQLASAVRRALRNSVVRFEEPLTPAFASDEWEMHR